MPDMESGEVSVGMEVSAEFACMKECRTLSSKARHERLQDRRYAPGLRYDARGVSADYASLESTGWRDLAESLLLLPAHTTAKGAEVAKPPSRRARGATGPLGPAPGTGPCPAAFYQRQYHTGSQQLLVNSNPSVMASCCTHCPSG